MALIIGRMAQPGSERATWRWLCQRSGLGDRLLEVDLESLEPHCEFYRVSDVGSMAHRKRPVEQTLYFSG